MEAREVITDGKEPNLPVKPSLMTSTQQTFRFSTVTTCKPLRQDGFKVRFGLPVYCTVLSVSVESQVVEGEGEVTVALHPGPGPKAAMTTTAQRCVGHFARFQQKAVLSLYGTVLTHHDQRCSCAHSEVLRHWLVGVPLELLASVPSHSQNTQKRGVTLNNF